MNENLQIRELIRLVKILDTRLKDLEWGKNVDLKESNRLLHDLQDEAHK